MIQPAKLIAIFETMYEEKWKYQLGAAREGVVDCSGAFAYAFRKLGGSIYHGSNTIWRKYTTEKGKLGQITLVPGMAVFRWRQSGAEPVGYRKDGLGDYYHMGLFIGDGMVIQAKSVSAGVIKSSVSGWHSAAKLTGVDYTGQTPETPGSQLPTLRKGSTGYWVTEAQLRLIAHGFPLAVYGADGIFGQETLTAVTAFQTAKGMDVDGVIGPETWEALNEEPDVEESGYQVIIPDLTQAEALKLKESYPNAIVQAPSAQANG